MPKTTTNQYNDPAHNYLHYWDGREYENAAEEIAIKRLLNTRHFKHAVDVGGGFGRLCVVLEAFADQVTLAEPSEKQLSIAADFLKDHPRIDQQLLQADDLKFPDQSVDLVTMVRVMHHLPDPTGEFAEIHRILTDDGWFVLEVANVAHALNRLKYFLRGKSLPVTPIDIRSAEHRTADSIAFVNHHPQTVIDQLHTAGFEVSTTLSVSNFRSPVLKKIFAPSLLLSAEKATQTLLAPLYFGPSIFFSV
jgi:ubiquinone/menaquinone biosynthesis C-methylase UbiE